MWESCETEKEPLRSLKKFRHRLDYNFESEVTLPVSVLSDLLLGL